jgi:hypothetical protein
MRVQIYHHFIKYGATNIDTGLKTMTSQYFDESYYYKELLEKNDAVIVDMNNMDIGVYFSAASYINFSNNFVLLDNLNYSISIGLSSHFTGIFKKYENISFLLSVYFSYNFYNYESVFKNILYDTARADFRLFSINAGIGVSLLKIHRTDILLIKPLCFQFLFGYAFFNQIDTKDYGNILLEDAKQVILGGKYFADFDLYNNLSILIELHYCQFLKPINVDPNIPFFITGLGLSLLIDI